MAPGKETSQEQGPSRLHMMASMVLCAFKGNSVTKDAPASADSGDAGHVQEAPGAQLNEEKVDDDWILLTEPVVAVLVSNTAARDPPAEPQQPALERQLRTHPQPPTQLPLRLTTRVHASGPDGNSRTARAVDLNRTLAAARAEQQLSEIHHQALVQVASEMSKMSKGKAPASSGAAVQGPQAILPSRVNRRKRVVVNQPSLEYNLAEDMLQLHDQLFTKGQVYPGPKRSPDQHMSAACQPSPSTCSPGPSYSRLSYPGQVMYPLGYGHGLISMYEAPPPAFTPSGVGPFYPPYPSARHDAQDNAPQGSIGTDLPLHAPAKRMARPRHEYEEERQ